MNISTSTAVLSALSFLIFSGPANALYSEYDYNNDGYLDGGEYVDYSYSVIDRDNDGTLGIREWADYSRIWYEPYDIENNVSFNEADDNHNVRIELSEYSDNFDSNLFDLWDEDNSGFVDYHEYNEVISVYDDADEEGLFDF